MGLKVFDLQCSNGHVFEGWFGSHDDYDSQQARGLVTCPLCQSDSVQKKLSAPRLNVGHFNEMQYEAQHQAKQDAESARGAPAVSTVNGSSDKHDVVAVSPELAQIQATLMQQMRAMISQTENVGERFAEEARSIHEGETEARPIRGTATREEREELAAEGIAVVALPDFLDTDRMH